MNKIKFIGMLIGYVVISFFLHSSSIAASSSNVSELPIASELTYGQPLFESTLIGGRASVQGEFKWSNEFIVLEQGLHTEKIFFIPSNSQYEKEEFEIDININKRKVYLSFENGLYKKYDESNTLKLPNYIVKGIIDSTVYIRGKLIATLENTFVGENIKVTLTGIELVGDKKDNYYLYLDDHTATIYPRYIEKFGNIKNRIDFSKNVYVPINSLIYVDQIQSTLEKKDYLIKEVYDVYVKNSNERVEISGDVSVKIKIPESNLLSNRIKVYNYYNSEYNELEYVYEDGYLIYSCTGLGLLVIAQRKLDFTWLYVLLTIIVLISIFFCIKKTRIKRKKINRYKSLKRSKSNGDY